MKPADLNTVIPFGKYKGKTVDEVSEFDGEYIIWLNRSTEFKVSDDLIEAIEQDARDWDDIIEENRHDIH